MNTVTATSLMKLVHGGNAFAGFSSSGYNLDISSGRNSNNAQLQDLVCRLRPGVIIEVGTWKGNSAVAMAQQARSIDLPTQVLCVDTWLGGLDQLECADDPERRDWFTSLAPQFGYPTLYYQFAANIIMLELTDMIVPVPNTSIIAGRWLKAKGVTAPLIYLDGSHAYEDVRVELPLYLSMLEAGGVLCGDDYDLFRFEEVVRAVDEFAHEIGRPVEFMPGNSRFWMITP